MNMYLATLTQDNDHLTTAQTSDYTYKNVWKRSFITRKDQKN